MRKTSTLLVLLLLCPFAFFAQSPVVISQVYGGAGCGTSGCSLYKNDFIELYNRTAGVVTLTGYSLQYTSATGSTWSSNKHDLPTITLQPGQYYLIAEGGNANGTNNLPTPDATGTLSLSATTGKVALVAGTTSLTGTCPSGGTVVDFVGYGSSANCFEGAAPAPSPANNNSSLLRQLNGRTDANNNATDFVSGTANPRNTSNFNTLPVSLSAFTAAKQAQEVNLHWKAANQGLASFVVERSGDGTNFTELATLPATAVADYRFTDKTPPSGNAHYRLKLLSANGRSTFSQTLLVKMADKGGLKIFPNPAHSFLTIQFVSRGQEILQLTDAMGRVQISRTVAAPGTVVTTLDVSDLANGVYFLKAGDQHTRFVKQ